MKSIELQSWIYAALEVLPGEARDLSYLLEAGSAEPSELISGEFAAPGYEGALSQHIYRELDRGRVEYWYKKLDRYLDSNSGARIVTVIDADYPTNLAGCFDRPPVLTILGQHGVGDTGSVALVGGREASPTGVGAARDLAAGAAESGICVVSGLARGIDTAAHWGALDAGGRTLAVLGSGVDTITPKENAGLAEAVQHSGALISQFAVGAPATRSTFPMRNAVIAALAQVSVVVEAQPRSGSFTAPPPRSPARAARPSQPSFSPAATTRTTTRRFRRSGNDSKLPGSTSTHEAAVGPATDQPDLDALRAEVASLTTENQQLRAHHDEFLVHMGARAKEVAEENEWCSVAQNLVEELGGVWPTETVYDFTVTHTWRIRAHLAPGVDPDQVTETYIADSFTLWRPPRWTTTGPTARPWRRSVSRSPSTPPSPSRSPVRPLGPHWPEGTPSHPVVGTLHRVRTLQPTRNRNCHTPDVPSEYTNRRTGRPRTKGPTSHAAERPHHRDPPDPPRPRSQQP